jgi:outer membrane protein OmpA-like peptidoglycan-associated protein
MKKIVALVLAVFVVTACITPPPPPVPEGIENPNVPPKIQVTIPELFSPDPDIVDDTLTINIAIDHPVLPLKDWQIQIQPIRQGQGGQQNQAQAGTRGERPSGQRNRRQTGPFFQQRGIGNPPEEWQWNGKGTSGEMVQSAMDYRFRLTVNDVFNNNAVYEGVISVDVLVRREGDILRMVVPSIIFPPDSSDFSKLNPEDTRSNARILGRVARILNKFEDYKITVEGHANPTTAPGRQRTAEENNELKPLSLARAQAVVDYLAANDDVNKERLTAIGMGGTRTVAEYNNEEENWKNRRVEFILKK